MSRPSGSLSLLVLALGMLAAVYLLFGDSLGGGTSGKGDAEQDAHRAAEREDLKAAGLESTGRRPMTPAQRAAERAARRAASGDFAPEEGVFGSVLDGNAEPIRGAMVLLLADPPALRRRLGVPDGPPLKRTSTGDDGRFVVGPCPEDGHARLRAEAPGYAPAVARILQRGVRVDLVLDRGGALEVRVLDGAGGPVGDAHVVHSAGPVVTAARTNEEGLAHFPGLPTGPGGLVVTRAGFGAVRDADVAIAPGETAQRTLILTQGVELVGSVRDAETERPLAGVGVTLRYPTLPSLKPGPGVLSDEAGQFRLTAFVSGEERVIVRLQRQGYAEGRVPRTGQSKGQLSVALHKAAKALTGRVLAADGQAAGGVQVTYASLTTERREAVPQTTSREDGTFTLPLPGWATPGSMWSVVGVSDDRGFGLARAAVPRKGRTAEPIEIQLGGTGRVFGTVTDGGGAPIQGALVSLAPDWNTLRMQPGRARSQLLLLRALQDGVHQNLSAVTGMDGTYEIRGVPALAYRATASFGLDTFTLPDSVTVRGGQRVEADIALAEGGTIEGRVQDAEGQPIAGALVSASPARQGGAPWWRTRPTVRSQSDGRFVLRGVADGRYNVHASASGYGNAKAQSASKGHTDLTLTLQARGWIEGIAYLDGRPCRGPFTIQVRLLDPRANETRRSFANTMWRPGQTTHNFNSGDGRFRVSNLLTGDYRVRASNREGQIAVEAQAVSVFDAQASRALRLTFQAGAVVTGSVRDEGTGTAVANAWVYATPVSERRTSTIEPPSGYGRTDSAGRYEVKGLGAGPYSIQVYVDGTPIVKQMDLSAGSRHQLDLVRRPPGSIHFVVSDPEGRPIPGARPSIQAALGGIVSVNVKALRADGLISDPVDFRSLRQTADDGALTRYHVPPGLHTVWARKSGYVSRGEKQTVEVTSGRVTHVRLTLQKK